MDWLHWAFLLALVLQLPLTYIGWVVAKLVWRIQDVTGRPMTPTEVLEAWARMSRKQDQIVMGKREYENLNTKR